MQKILIILYSILLIGCGSSSDSSSIGTLELSGTFSGIDNLTNQAQVSINGDSVEFLLKTLPQETIISGTIIKSIASSGKKGKQETTNVDLRIDSSNLSVFVVGETSLGRIINTNNTNVSFQFNFTLNQTRPSADIDSDWSMDGNK